MKKLALAILLIIALALACGCVVAHMDTVVSDDDSALCEKECLRFKMTFYKYFTGNGHKIEECWCLKDGVPYNIGFIRNEVT